MACGAAGGISATFNAPIAGVFFALELILRNFETRSFGLVVLSSITADAIGRAAFGSHPFLSLPTFAFGSPLELLLYAGLGVLAAAVGLAFVRVLYKGEDVADRLWHGPDWLRPAAGGVLLGLLLLVVPQMYGVGYPVLEQAVGGHYVIVVLLGLLARKDPGHEPDHVDRRLGRRVRAIVVHGRDARQRLRRASPTSGCHTSPPPPGAYGLVGMGAVFAASARAPITAVIIIFELTGDYRIILPLMLAIVVATALSNAITRDTIYTLKLRRRGVDIDAPAATGRLTQITIGEAMGSLPRPLAPNQPLTDVLTRFSAERTETLPVIDDDGTLLGVVAASDVEQALAHTPDGLRASALLHAAPDLHADQPVQDAVRALAATEDAGLPILNGDNEVVGWVTHRRLLRATSAHIAGE